MARATFSHLPAELIIETLARLDAADLARTLCTCKSLHSLTEASWRASCFRRWARWSSIAAVEPEGLVWRRQYELLELREEEEACVPDVAHIRKLQQTISERHRSILTEWLCEVSFDWSLESTLVYKAAMYLDHYLGHHAVTELHRFQLVGLACLRAAMGDGRKPTSLAATADDAKSMDPQRFAYISDDTYTAEEVEECTQVVAALVPPALKAAPNAKMFLRSFWYRATTKEVVCADEMHIYTLASFLLQLSLLDLECSSHSASLRASAALSLALSYFGKPEWPAALQSFGSYEAHELAPCRRALAQLQASATAAQLRPLWRQQHEGHGYGEYRTEWDRCLAIFACPSRMLLAAAGCTESSSAASSPRDGATFSPAPEDSPAMMLD